MLTDTTLKRLDTISLLSKEGKKINGLFRLMENRELWKQAYINMRIREGAVKGVDHTTLDGFLNTRIDGIIGQIWNKQYKFEPVRRTSLSKENVNRRPSGISDGNDKLVQEVVRIILERIYEPVFSDLVHGSRTGRSCHTALEQVRRSWTGAKWLIVTDAKCFLSYSIHKDLIRILERKIDDRRFIKLIEAMLRAGCMINWNYNSICSGTVPGGIISPILSDIYLSELDNFMEQYASQFDTGKRNGSGTQYPDRSIKAIGETRVQIPSGGPYDKTYKRVFYNRHTSKFMIGITGSRADAVKTVHEIQSFLNDKLAMAEDNFKIVHAAKGVNYLGFVVRSHTGHWINNLEASGAYIGKRVAAERMQLIIPKEEMQEFARQRGYGNYCTAYAKSRPALIRGSDAEIISTYNSELRELVNYYSIANHARKSLGCIVSMGRISCVMTLAHKHKMSTDKMASLLKQPDGEWIREIKTGKVIHNYRVYRLKTDFPHNTLSCWNPDI